jgi:hypothetical protein
LDWKDFKTLYSKEAHTTFLELQLKKDLPLILVKGETIYKTGHTHSFFNKLFTGKKLPIDSPYFDDELIIKNSLPLIYVTNDKEKYRTMLNLYNKLNSIKIDTIELNVPEKYFESADWLRREFLCIGQNTAKINTKLSIRYEVDQDMVIEKFLKTCCSFGKDKNCSKQDLYEAYKNYFKHCYPDEEYLGPIVFSKRVKKIKHEDIEEYRPHEKKKGPYLRCFKYIGIKENYSELYKDEPVHEHVKSEKENFEIMLNQLVDETFKNIHFNKRVVSKTIDINTGEIIQKHQSCK